MLGGLMKVQENLLVCDDERLVFLYSFESHPKEITSDNEMILTIRGSYNEELDAPHWVKDMKESDFIELLSKLNVNGSNFLSMLFKAKELQELFSNLREQEEPYEFLIQNDLNKDNVEKLKSQDPIGQLHNLMNELKELTGFDNEQEQENGELYEGQYNEIWKHRTETKDLDELQRLNEVDTEHLKHHYFGKEALPKAVDELIEMSIVQSNIINILIEKSIKSEVLTNGNQSKRT